MPSNSASLASLTLADAQAQLRAKQISLPELYTAITVAQKTAEKLHIYLTPNQQAASQAAERSQLPLAGIPIAVKDNFCTQDLRTTASSTVLDTFIPQFESTVTRKLQAAGGVITGKTNMDAWAHGSSTETSQYGRTLNPRNPEHLPGGSSGGSAAAVAADTCIAALGTETAGSIRQPSAWCGVVGLKPTYGRVSRAGVVAMASSTDSPGPITKTVEDAAILLSTIAGHDPYDATSSAAEVPDFSLALNQPIKKLKIGVLYTEIEELRAIHDLFIPQLEVLKKLGAEVEMVNALDPHHAIGVYTVVQRAEVSSNLARFTGVRYGHDRSYFGDEAKRRIMLGTYTLSKGYSDQYYMLAQKVRTLFLQDYQRLFETHDILISLSSPGFAKKIGASSSSAMFGELEDMLLEPSSITGYPGVSVPCYRDPATNLYLGMNILAPMWQEARAITVADAFEKHSDWNSWRKESHE